MTNNTLLNKAQEVSHEAYDIRALISATNLPVEDATIQINALLESINQLLEVLPGSDSLDPSSIYNIVDLISNSAENLRIVSEQLSSLDFSVEDRLSIYTNLSKSIISLNQASDGFVVKQDPNGSIRKINNLDSSVSPEIKDFLVEQTALIHQLQKENGSLSRKIGALKSAGEDLAIENEKNLDEVKVGFQKQLNDKESSDWFDKRAEVQRRVRKNQRNGEYSDPEDVHFLGDIFDTPIGKNSKMISKDGRRHLD
jgi:vacuolar-type H+-ATPase subunit I/STV1